MKFRTFALTMVAAGSLFACDGLTDKITDALPEITLGGDDGIPPVSGSTSFALPADFKCGDPIADPQMKYEITTSGTDLECTFIFDQKVPVLKAADYSKHPELEGAYFVKRVDMDVKSLAVKDETGAKIEPKSLSGTAFGSPILTTADLTKAPPFTKSIEGAPLDSLKTAVDKEQDIVIPIHVEILVNMAPMPPGQVILDFDAQPNLVFGI